MNAYYFHTILNLKNRMSNPQKLGTIYVYALPFQKHCYIKKQIKFGKRYMPKIIKNVPLLTNIFRINSLYLHKYLVIGFEQQIFLIQFYGLWLLLITQSLCVFFFCCCYCFFFLLLGFVELCLQSFL